MNHQYDVFGRATTTSIGADVISRNNYDGFDRLIRQREWDSAGVHQHTKNITLDPFDRTSRQTTRVTTKPSVTTRFVYLGMRDQVAAEEQTNTAGEYETSKVFTHGPGGEKLALVDTPVNGTTTSKRFYGTNPHTDVETLTNDSTGLTEATYRYTAYGNPDTAGTLGEDAVTGDPVQDAEVVNPYRFNSKRFDGATGTYDMGFREYDPGLNRFLSRDMYNGALADMRLGADPWNTNRYAFAGGNPIGRSEIDGHESSEVCPYSWCAIYTPEDDGPQASDPADSPLVKSGVAKNGAAKQENVVKRKQNSREGSAEYASLVMYTFDEILINSKSESADALRYSTSRECLKNEARSGGFGTGCLSFALAKWYDLVKPGGEWDHKSTILGAFDMVARDDVFTPIPGTVSKVSYEVWSNIHYGYVGLEVGFGAGALELGADAADIVGQGKVDHGDQQAVLVGIILRRRYGLGELRPEHIHEAILESHAEFSQTGKIIPCGPDGC